MRVYVILKFDSLNCMSIFLLYCDKVTCAVYK